MLQYIQLEGNGPIDERATVAEVSVANFNFIFGISYFNYPGHDGLQMTSKVIFDLKIELSALNYLCSHAFLACKCFPEMIDTTETGQL